MSTLKTQAVSVRVEPHIKEAPSTIPAPCESGACPVLASGEPGTSLEQESLIPDSLNLIPDSLSLDSQQNPDQEGTLYGGGVPGTGDTPPPREAPPKKRTPAPLKPKLEAILGPKGSPDEVNYWKLVGIFGAAKNPAPTQTAQAFVDALLKVPVHSILAKAQNLKDTLSGPQYMPQLLKWLDGQGYMNPDASVSSGGPMASVTDEYARYLDGGEVADAS